jgi:hypothetical protein
LAWDLLFLKVVTGNGQLPLELGGLGLERLLPPAAAPTAGGGRRGGEHRQHEEPFARSAYHLASRRFIFTIAGR